ncbi:MAG: PilZ domain-containing protein [Gammaproteobacteria bacterium]
MAANGKLLKLAIPTAEELHRRYMPFVNGGGLFVSTEANYQLADDVYLLVDLPSETQQVGVEGKIVWVSPASARSHFRHQGSNSGVGIQFIGTNAPTLKAKIEKILAGRTSVATPTLTL